MGTIMENRIKKAKKPRMPVEAISDVDVWPLQSSKLDPSHVAHKKSTYCSCKNHIEFALSA